MLVVSEEEPMARFVAVSAALMLSALRSIGEKVVAKGGAVVEGLQGSEIVFDITPPGSPAFVRIYTSLARGAADVRDCGEDAVRVVVMANVDGRAKPLAKSRRIYRTAPGRLSDEARQAAFIERMTDALRDHYREARSIEKCPECGAPLALREPKSNGKQFTPFLGCTRFPTCKGSKRAA
jgi:hypothetical protein